MDLLARLRATAPPLLWDGGVGTGLIARGLLLRDEAPESWLLRRPDEVRRLHEAFAHAGSDVLQTNTFGLPRLLYRPDAAVDPSLPVDAQARLIMDRAAALARQAAAGTAVGWVVASLGPTGQDQPDPGRVEALYGELATACEAAGLDALHLETCLDAGELAAALRGVRAGSRALQIGVSLTLLVGDEGLVTPRGARLAALLRVLDGDPPDWIGVNCSENARRMAPQVAALFDFSRGRLPILAQPQIDDVGVDCKRRTPPETGARFAAGLRGLLEAGASAVGGCCGCRAEHLAAARAEIGPPLCPAPMSGRAEDATMKEGR